MLTIHRTASADRDLDLIWLYIAQDSVTSANLVIEVIEQTIDMLYIFPDGGLTCPQLGSNIRRLISGNYLIYYFHQDDTVIILRVLDGHRDITPDMLVQEN